MRLPTQFTPPPRKYGESLFSHCCRCDKAKKEFEDLHKKYTGGTRDDKLKSFIPNDDLK